MVICLKKAIFLKLCSYKLAGLSMRISISRAKWNITEDSTIDSERKTKLYIIKSKKHKISKKWKHSKKEKKNN